MSTYREAIDHVKAGGEVWEKETWDTNSFIYLKNGEVWCYSGYDRTDQKYVPYPEEMDSKAYWELL